MSKVNISEELDRSKILDEAIFLALCGRDQVKNNLKITGVVRLEMAVAMLHKIINKINKDIDAGNTI